ncbi:kinase-like domain-containing protein [Phaeosphaeriaceae sp. PMI808]|nr:kinase-like domain-containing protein [Phaeosphaeriaceae sp. PMI808]
MPIRRPRIGHLSSPASSDSKPQEQDGTSLVDFLSVLQENNVTLLPISPHKGLRIIGRGLSGLIQQSSADIVTNLAFKHGIPSGLTRDSKKDRDWQCLITEVRILQHPPIQKSYHVVDLVGVSFSVDSSTASPVLVTLKANRGDLSSLIFNNNRILAGDGICIQLVAEIAEAIHLLHGCGVAHGDIKPENILVEQSEEGILNCLLTDFGSSVVQGQKRLPTSSEPWSAPELQTSSDPVGFEFLRQADLFSFGLVCMLILIPLRDLERANLCFIRHPDHTENQWAQLRNDWKVKKSKAGQEALQGTILSLVESVNISAKRKGPLKTIIKATLQPQPGNRQMPWTEMLPHIKEYLSQGCVSYHMSLSHTQSSGLILCIVTNRLSPYSPPEVQMHLPILSTSDSIFLTCSASSTTPIISCDAA